MPALALAEDEVYYGKFQGICHGFSWGSLALRPGIAEKGPPPPPRRGKYSL